MIMKKVDFLKKLLLTVMLVTGFAFSNAYGQDSLQVYYDGETAPPVDLSGNNNSPADKTPQLTDSGIGLLGQCFDLGSSSIVRGGGFDLGITNQFTIMAFVNPTACTGGIFNYSGFSINSWKIDDNTIKFKCTMRIDDDKDTDIWFEVPDEHNVAVGEWYHIAFTYDGTDAKIYIDGQEVLTQAQTVDHINVEKNNMRIALGYGYVGQGSYFTGKVDEAKILNKALSQAQIANEALIAYAGEDQSVGLGTTVTLDGSKSIGAITSFEWTLDGQVVGSTAVISTDTLSGGSHVFTLTVSDGTNTRTDDVTVNVANVLAVAGEDQTADEGTLVTLDGSASVGSNLTYKWTLNGAEVGNTASISTDTLSLGDHTFTLEVTDGTETSSDDVVITIKAITVVADAGANQAVTKGFMLTLNASKSTGYQLTYNWRLNETDIGTTPVISTDTLSVGKHTFALAVTDIHGTTAADTVYIDVEGTESLVDFETMYTNSDTSFVDLKNNKEYLIFDVSNGTDKTNGDRLPDVGAVPALVPGVKGQAMEFDGKRDWVDLQYAYTRGGFNANSEDYSTSIWFNAAKTHEDNIFKSPAMVIYDAPGFGLMLWKDTLCIAAYMRDRDNKSMPVGSAKLMVPFKTTDEWTHVALVFDGAATANKDSSIFKVYINNKLVSTDTIGVPYYYADWYDWAIVGSHTGYAALSSVFPESMIPYASEGEMQSHFKGAVDELINERTAWTEQDVQDIYNDRATAIFETKDYNTINVYPNPTSGILNITGIDGKGEVEILNLSGAVVKAMHIANAETVNISDLNSGIYIIRIKTADTIYTSKVVLTK